MPPAITTATYGVERVRWSRPTRLGICRLVASEYVSRDRPSIVPFTAWMSSTDPTTPSV